MFDVPGKAVFFGAHTDDELVCAGTLHRLLRQRWEVHVVTFAAASVEGDAAGTMASMTEVCHEWERSLDAIGVGGNRRCCWLTPAIKLHEKAQEIANVAYEFCERVRPDAAFILSSTDENPSHAAVGAQCERVMRGRVPVVIRCHFPSPWNYRAQPANLFVRLDESDVEVKRKVWTCYKSQRFRYDYGAIFATQAVLDGLGLKTGPVERFEMIRGVL